MLWAVVCSPIGAIGIGVDHDAIVRVSFGAPDGAWAQGRFDDRSPGSVVLREATRQVREFIAGERTRFDLPMVVRQGSDFDRAVWAAIAAIPYGQTSTYGAIARTVGEPGAAQAVGLACNRNPVPVIVPCHRVIGSNGKLVGFGGGLHRKRWLLEREACVTIERTFAGGSV